MVNQYNIHGITCHKCHINTVTLDHLEIDRCLSVGGCLCSQKTHSVSELSLPEWSVLDDDMIYVELRKSSRYPQSDASDFSNGWVNEYSSASGSSVGWYSSASGYSSTRSWRVPKMFPSQKYLTGSYVQPPAGEVLSLGVHWLTSVSVFIKLVFLI